MSIVQAKYTSHHSMLMFIVFYSLSKCPQMYAVLSSFHSAKEVEKNPHTLAELEQETKDSKGITMDLLLCFVPIFLHQIHVSAVFLPFAVQSFQTCYGMFHKEIFSSHKALLSAHQSNTIIPISLVRKPRLKYHQYGICTAGKQCCVFQAMSVTRTLRKQGTSVCCAQRGRGREEGKRGTRT